jgi:hypothetical protein
MTRRSALSPPHFTSPWLRNQYVVIWLGTPGSFEPNPSHPRIGHLAAPQATRMVRTRYPAAESVALRNREMVLQALCAGQIEMAYMELRLLEAFLLNRPAGCETAAFRVRVLSDESASLAVASSLQYAPVADELREGIEELIQEGAIYAYMDRWFVFSSVEASDAGAGEAEEQHGAGRRNLRAGRLYGLAHVFAAACARPNGARPNTPTPRRANSSPTSATRCARR